MSDARAATPRLVPHAGGHFQMQIPEGWQVIRRGDGTGFSVLLRDPRQPLRQAWLMGEIGPYYIDAQQQIFDRQYMAMGGFPVTWADMPIVFPLSPAAFLTQFQHMARSQMARQLFPEVPTLDGLQVTQTEPQPPAVPIPGAQAARMRARFTGGGKPATGVFLVTVAPANPMPGMPGSGLGVAYQFSGATAPEGELAALEPILVHALGSLSLSPAYLQQCGMAQQQNFRALQQIGSTLRETSDIVTGGYQQRQATMDAIAERRADAMRGLERLYDPDTGEVLQFQSGFYDQYRLDPDRFQRSRLQPIPEDRPDLWQLPPLDGSQHFR